MQVNRPTRRSERRRRAWRRVTMVLAALALLGAGLPLARVWWRTAQAERARADGLAAHRSGEWAVAIRQLSIAVRRQADDGEALFALGDSLVHVPRPDRQEAALAVRTLQAALHAGAPRRKTLERLLEIDLGSGMLPEAEAAARALRADDPGHREALRALVAILEARGLPDEARALLGDAIADRPGDLGLRVAWIDAAARSGVDRDGLLATIDGWLLSGSAPPGTGDLRSAVMLMHGAQVRGLTLDPPFDASWRPSSAAEASVRALVLTACGRVEDACEALARGSDLDSDDALAREAIRIRALHGDFSEATQLIATLRRESIEARRRHAVLAASVSALEDPESEVAEQLAGIETGDPAVQAWCEAMRAVGAGKLRNAALRTPSMSALEPLALATLEYRLGRRMLADGFARDAIEHARRGSAFAAMPWVQARILEIEALAAAGDDGEALAICMDRRKRDEPATAGSRCMWIAATLRVENACARRVGAPVRRPAERLADAEALLADPSADLAAQITAGETMVGLANRAGARAALEGLASRIAAADAGPRDRAASLVRLADLAAFAARAFDDLDLTVLAQRAISDSSVASDAGCRWALARLAALEAERRGSFEEARMLLCTEAEQQGSDSRMRLAECAALADRFDLPGAADAFRRSMPEGAATAAVSRASSRDAALCRAVLEALGAPRPPDKASTAPSAELVAAPPRVCTAIAALRLSRLDGAAMPSAEALELADRALARAGRDARLLAEIGETLLVVEPVNPALAGEYLRRAWRLEPSRFDIARRAMQAMKSAGDRAGIVMLADELPTGAASSREIERLRVAALVEGGELRRAAEHARRLADQTRADADHALAARALAMLGEIEAARHEADRGLEDGPSPQCASVLSALLEPVSATGVRSAAASE